MAGFTKKQAKEIIHRLKSMLEIKTDAELANYLGLAETTIATWKRRGTVDIPLIIEKVDELSLDELIYGSTQSESSAKLTVYGLDSGGGNIAVPLYSSRVSAGRPLEVTEDVEGYIYPNKRFHKGTFMVGVQGDSMTGVGIMDGDKLLVDTLKEPREGNIVIARVDGALTVKTLNFSDGGVLLSPENPKYEPIQVDEDTAIIGVVVATQRDFI